MTDDIKKRVLDAFLLVLRPVVRILLRYGVGYREFAEITKTAFVDIASSDFGIRGRPTNISRVAVMTGLTRKEVKRLRDQIAKGNSAITVKTTPFEDVLHHWHAQSEFLANRAHRWLFHFLEKGFLLLILSENLGETFLQVRCARK